MKKLTMLAALCGVLAFGCGGARGPVITEDEDPDQQEIVRQETIHCPNVCTYGLDSAVSPGVEDKECTMECKAAGETRVRECAGEVTILKGSEREKYIWRCLEKHHHPD